MAPKIITFITSALIFLSANARQNDEFTPEERMSDKNADTLSFVHIGYEVSGVVKDQSNKKRLENVSIMVPGTNIGTVTNKDGYFSLIIPDSLENQPIRIEQIGYKASVIVIDKATNENPLAIFLIPSAIMLNEVTVYGAEPRSLIESALEKIPQNYSSIRNMFSSFYRETIQKGKQYIGVSEAIVNVMKTPYKGRNISGDRVQVMKGRRLVSQKNSDTLAVKIVGGPTLPVVMDFVKNDNLLFAPHELDYYNFKMEPMTAIDDRLQYVIRFSPKIKVDYALHKGLVYIDQERLSFTRAEFNLDISDKEKATRAILYKKPGGLHFKPQEIEFTVAYKLQDGITYLNYVRTKIRFKCDWKRRLFSSSYTAYAEMVMVDREDNPTVSISRKESFGERKIFYDMVDDFKDEDFWKGYTIIEPTESLEKAVGKLSASQTRIHENP